MEKNDNEVEIMDITCNLYIDIFSQIEMLPRFLQIINAMPFLPHKNSEITKLKHTFDNVKDCRNYLQHIREHLSKEDIINYPILGSVSWINENKNYTIIPTQFTENHNSRGIAFDSIIRSSFAIISLR